MAAAVKAAQKAIGQDNDRVGGAGASRDTDRKRKELFKIDDAMARVARRMASRVVLIGVAIAGAAGQAVALTDALWPMIGALGAIPAVATAGIFGIAALVVGFKGLGAAMKKTGGGAGNAAQQIANAEHRVEQAHRSLRDATEALNDAQEEAADHVRDMAVAYARSQLDQKEAALAVKDAEKALRDARMSGNRDDIKRAELALESARLSQIETTNQATDTAQEYGKAQTDAANTVRNAQERQADAAYELAEAQRALAEAGKGGGGSDAYAKLSASAKALVDTLHSLGPAWKGVQQATQERLFSGVAGDLQALSGRYLPVMLTQLPAIAQGWNNMFRSMMAAAGAKSFVADIDASLGKMAVMWQRIGDAFGPFLHGFKDWVVIGSDFLPRLGSWVERMATRWRNWSADVRETGRGMRWIENALKAGHQFNELIGAWSKNIGRIFALGADGTLMDRLIGDSRKFGEWLHTAEGTERVTQMWARLREVGSAMWGVIKNLTSVLAQLDVSGVTIALQTFSTILAAVGHSLVVLNPLFKVLIPVMVGFKVAAIAAGVATKLFGLTLKVLTDAFSLLILKTEAYGFATATTARQQALANGVMTTSVAKWRQMDAALTTASVKTALAGVAMAGLSVGVGVLGVQMMRSGGTVEGLLMLGLAATGLVGNIRSAVIPAITALIARFGAWKVAMVGIVGVAALAGAAFYLWYQNAHKVRTESHDLTRDLETLAATGVKVGTTSRLFAEWGNNTERLFEILKSNKGGRVLFAGQTGQDFKDLDAAMTSMVDSGRSVADVTQMVERAWPGFSVQAAIAAGQLTQFADAQERANAKTRAGKDAIEGATGALQEYTDAQLAATDHVLGWVRAQERQAEAQQAYNDAVAQFGAGSPQAIAAAWDLQEANAALEAALSTMTKDDIPKYLTMLGEMLRNNQITQETYDALVAKLKEYGNQLDALNNKRVKVYIDQQTQRRFMEEGRGHGVLEYATGGVVPGPKGKAQPAIVHGGEVVINPDMPGQHAPMQGLGTGGPQVLDINLNISGGTSDLDRAAVAWLRKLFRTQGAVSFGLRPA